MPDKQKPHWFWGKFPSARGKPQEPAPPEPQKPSKRSRFIRKVGEFFKGSKKEPEPAPTSPTPKNFDTPLLEEDAQESGDKQTVKERELSEAELEHVRMLEAEEFEEYSRDQVALSLCRCEVEELKSDIEVVRAFMKHKVRFEDFNRDFARYLKHPNLLIKIHSELYNPDVGIPQIISLLAFKQVINLRQAAPEAAQAPDAEAEAAETEMRSPPPSPTQLPAKKR